MSDPHSGPDELVGVTDRDAVLAADSGWRDALAQASPASDPAHALGDVPPGATLTVYFGVWCGDSRREVTRLWAALDMLGAPPPFDITYVAVDRAKSTPDGLVDRVGLRYVPTFVVQRDGAEVGRVIESAPHGLETDLAALLRGEATGVVSGRTDL